MYNNVNYAGLVSIIMPSWNTAGFIDESIESVINQTYSNWELIIVDDCSSDNTDDIVALYDDNRIKYLKNKQNIGAALTRNRALREARGEWISFLDSDDLWHPDKLKEQIMFMERNGYNFSYTNYEKIDEEGNDLFKYVTGPSVVDKSKIYKYDYIGQLTMMYNSKDFGLVQIEDIKKNNDYAIRLKLFEKPGSSCYLLDKNLAKYRIRSKSISHDKLYKKLKSHYDLFHYCDNKNSLISIILTLRNMIFGVFKKMVYEKNNFNKDRKYN